jgi:hypothetical protein
VSKHSSAAFSEDQQCHYHYHRQSFSNGALWRREAIGQHYRRLWVRPHCQERSTGQLAGAAD